MSSRLVALLLLLLPAVASAQGGHPVEFGLYAGRVDFDRDIRFADDTVVGLRGELGVAPWFSLGVGFGQITARDRFLDEWSRIVLATIHGRVEPWPERRVCPGLLMGVSFMGFTEADRSDALSEGLDLAPSLRWNLAPGWTLRADWLLRIQSFKVQEVDLYGRPTGGRKENGYLWSRIARVGVTHAF